MRRPKTRPDVTLRCPGCDGLMRVTGPPDLSHIDFSHSEPTCERFDSLAGDIDAAIAMFEAATAMVPKSKSKGGRA